MKTGMKLLIIGTAALMLTACSSDQEQGSVQDYQSSQLAAKNNCQINANDYIEANDLDIRVSMDTDSTISRKHLAGDGWCSGNIVKGGQITRAKLYCRSTGTGCKANKPSDDGKPNPNLDHSKPIPK